MKYIRRIIRWTKLLGLFLCAVISSGIYLREILIKEEIEKPVKVFESKVAEKVDNTYKYIINPIRDNLGEVRVTSIIRFDDPNSQHYAYRYNEFAADFNNRQGVTNWQIYWFYSNHMPFDQIILYGNIMNPRWVHISRSNLFNRYEVLLRKGWRFYEVN